MSASRHAEPTGQAPCGPTRLLLRTDAGTHHVEVDWDDDVGGLAAALVGRRSSLVVDGVAHASDTPLHSIALPRGAHVRPLDGTALGVRPSPEPALRSTTATAALALEVVAGPGGGEVHVLGPGTHVVGRDRACDVVLTGPAVSAHHAEVRVADDGRVTVADLGSRNGIAGGPATGAWTVDTCCRLGDTALRLVALSPSRSIGRVPAGASTVPVTRALRPVAATPPPPLGDPPQRQPDGTPRPLRWSMVLAPVVVAVAMAALVDPRFALFAGLGPVTAVGSWWEDRRVMRRRSREADEAHDRAMTAWSAATAGRAQVLSALAWREHPGIATAIRRAGGDPSLWSVRPDDDAFGHVAVGVGPSTQDQRRVDPLVVDLRGGRVLGLVGAGDLARGLLDAVLTQLATTFGPDDLTVLPHAGRTTWQWLPHVPDAVPLGEADGPGVTGGWCVAVMTATAAAHPEVRAAVEAGRLAVIVLADSTDQLSDLTTTTVEVTATGIVVCDEHGPRSGLPSTVDVSLVTQVVDRLRVLRTPAGARSDVPEVVTLGALLAGRRLLESRSGDDVRVLRRPRSGDGLAVCIGEDGDGPVVLDLVADGPHTLVGGTTGSGKSELLRSLVLALAVEHDAATVQFVLIDFKGGATFDAFAELPHTVALQTDLDGADARRTMLHLEAELRRREELLRAAGVGDLADLRDGPARLVVVVDELAAFLATYDRAGTALADVAQRGRSLGVHLVLATQRPSGAVGPDVRANTALRIALRTEDETDARDVVDDPGPATIDRRTPGRAHVRVAGRLRVVQTAHTTAPARGGCRSLTSGAAVDHGEDELTRFVAAVRRAGIATARTDARWPPSLPDRLRPTDLDIADDADDGQVVLGLLDEPAQLRRRPLVWHPVDGPLTVHGLHTAGAVDVLTAAAFDLARRRSPETLHVEAIDVGTGSLRGLASWPHVAAVHDGDDREAVERLLDRLRARIVARRAGRGAVRTLLLVDGLDRLRSRHDDVAGHRLVRELVDLAVDGAAHGVHVAVTTARPHDLPSPLVGASARRLVLTLAEPTDHALLGMRLDDLPTQLRGRGYDAATGCHVQVTRVDLTDAAAVLEARWPEAERPSPPPRLPRIVQADALPGPRPTPGGWEIAVGIDAASLEPIGLPVVAGEHLLVIGPARSGRTTLARRVADGLAHPSLPDVIVLTRRPDEWLDRPHATVATTPDDLPEVTRPTLLVVEDAARHPDHARLTAAVEDTRVSVLATGRPGTVRLHHAAWLRRVRVDRVGALLRPTSDADGALLDVVVRGPTAGLPDGRGYVVRDGEVVQTQFAVPTGAP